MNIVVLDGGSTNPGDLSWGPLEALGALTVYGETPASLFWERSRDADALIVNRPPLGRDLLERLPKLRYIGCLATGYNTIDVAAARKLGITVCNVPHYCENSVAQHALSLLLFLCQHISQYDNALRREGWRAAEKLNPQAFPLIELSGKNLGILGFGTIGRRMAELGRALGMNILLYSRSKKAAPPEYRWVTLDQLFLQSDVVSIHCPLTEETRGLVGKELLSQMKPTSLLLNTSRGGVVDGPALAEALNNGSLAGAGLDVLSAEPPDPEDPLLQARNCVITPHVAWAARESRERLIHEVAENLRRFILGAPQNVVN